MPFQATNIYGFEGLMVIEPKVFGDERGFFMETYSYNDFEKIGIKTIFIQDNHSRSGKNILRGLHFQNPPHMQAKLVRCIRGEIMDVAVDIRKDSHSYGKWCSQILSETNRKMFYVPEGFAHGFLTLSEIAEVCYKVDKLYSPESEGGIIWNDPDLDITWPAQSPTLSDKDKRWPRLKDLDPPFIYKK